METTQQIVPTFWDDDDPATRRLIEGRTGILRIKDQLKHQIDELCLRVRDDGDRAVKQATAQYDKRTIASINVGTDELDKSADKLDHATREALDHAIGRITAFNQDLISQSSWERHTITGDTWGEIARPVAAAGLFVPNGKGSFPSVAVQIGAPARAAGVTELVMAVPPNSIGPRLDSATAYVAKALDIKHVMCANGPAMIAAMTYGTDSVPKMPLIVGPGSLAIVAAQQHAHAAGAITVSGLGPTDSIIIADKDANPKLLAYDLVNEAEHGPDSSAILLTTDTALANTVAKLVPDVARALPLPRRDYALKSIVDNGGIFVVTDELDAIRIANELAGEHLQLAINEPRQYLPYIKNAGTILLGQSTTFAASNYIAGTPATLPTTGAAKLHSGVTAHTYMKQSSYVELSHDTLSTINKHIIALADYEGFPAHANTSIVRMETRQ